MKWVIIIIIIVGFIIWRFFKDTKKIHRENLSLGGMKTLFPEYVEYFERNGFELIEDSGTNLVYKKALTDDPPLDKYLYLGIEHKFTNIAYSYIKIADGKKIKGQMVEFKKNSDPEEVDMVIRKITGGFQINGEYNIVEKKDSTENQGD